jgi:hypothetical protein
MKTKIEIDPRTGCTIETTDFEDGDDASDAETPWGLADHIQVIRSPAGNVITFYGTPSHGGYHLDLDMRSKIPEEIDEFRIGSDGWFEEDVDWAIVAYVYPEFFPPETKAEAEALIRQTSPLIWCLLCG